MSSVGRLFFENTGLVAQAELIHTCSGKEGAGRNQTQCATIGLLFVQLPPRK